MSAGLFTATTPSQFNQDLAGWDPCDLHRRGNQQWKISFFSNEASPEALSAAME